VKAGYDVLKAQRVNVRGTSTTAGASRARGKSQSMDLLAPPRGRNHRPELELPAVASVISLVDLLIIYPKVPYRKAYSMTWMHDLRYLNEQLNSVLHCKIKGRARVTAIYHECSYAYSCDTAILM